MAAETRVGVRLEAKGTQETSRAIGDVGRASQDLQRKSSGLTSALKKLGTAFLGLLAARKVVQFLRDATQASMEHEKAATRLHQIMTQVSGATKEQINDYIKLADELQNVGVVSNSVAIAGMSQLASFTKNHEVVGLLAKDLLDLSVATYGVNVTQDQAIQSANMLGKALTGQLGAMTRAGVLVSDEYAKAFEAANTEMERAEVLSRVLADNYGGLNQAMLDTAEGAMANMRNRWNDMKRQMGDIAAVTMVNLGTAIVDTMTSGEEATRTFAYTVGYAFNVSIPQFLAQAKSAFGEFAVWYWEWAGKIAKLTPFGHDVQPLWSQADIKKFLEDPSYVRPKQPTPATIIDDIVNERVRAFEGWIKTEAELLQELQAREREFDEAVEQMATGRAGVAGYIAPDLLESFGLTDDASLEAERAADRIRSAFESVGRSIVNAMSRSTDEINRTREEISRVTEATEDSVKRLEDAYEKDLQNMARRTQENIDRLDEQINAEKNTMARGWRDRIAELEREKAKENEVMARLEKKGVAIKEEIAKDELTRRREQFEKEMAEEKERGARRVAQLEIEALEKEKTTLESLVGLLQPGKIQELITAEEARKPWEPSPLNVYFNFEGDISDKDELIQVITDHLNRLSELKQFTGE